MKGGMTMTVEYGNNQATITYDNDECEFVKTLDDIAQKNIRRGLATPYDYGYKPSNSN